MNLVLPSYPFLFLSDEIDDADCAIGCMNFDAGLFMGCCWGFMI